MDNTGIIRIFITRCAVFRKMTKAAAHGFLKHLGILGRLLEITEIYEYQVKPLKY